MENLNAEQIKKELVLLIDDMPVELHFSHKKTRNFLSFLKSILTVIETYDQKIFELENRLKECENGYEGTLHLERAKIKELTEEVADLKAIAEQYQKQFEEAKADTVREMQERLKQENTTAFGSQCEVIPFYVIDQIAKKMLEG